MTYVLDTNAVSALMRADARVLIRVQKVAKREILVPHPVFAELAYGVARLPKSKKKDLLQRRFDLVQNELGRSEWTDAVSKAFGDIKAHLEKRGTRIEDFDVAVAAHARAHGAVLVTSNVAHMLRVPGLRIEDWAK